MVLQWPHVGISGATSFCVRLCVTVASLQPPCTRRLINNLKFPTWMRMHIAVFFSFHNVDLSRVQHCLHPQAPGPGGVQEGCSPERHVQSRARKDLWHKLPPKKQKRQCFLMQSWEIIPQKTEWGSEYGGGTKHSWIIGFVLCGCSTWPHNSPSLKKTVGKEKNRAHN